MNRYVVILLLIALAFLVPLSSRRPDAIQHVLGLPGGVDAAPKAIRGIAIAAAAVIGIVYLLKWCHRRNKQ